MLNKTETYIYGTKPNVPDYLIKNGKTYKILSDNLGSVKMVVCIQTGKTVQEIFFFTKEPLGFAGSMNFYVYAGGDSVNFVDVSGLKLWYADEASRKEFEDDIKIIMTTKLGRHLLKTLNDRRVIYLIHLRKNEDSEQKNNDVYINPNINFFICVNSEASNSYKWVKPSVTRVLAHELGHLTGTKDDGFDNLNNVDMWENPIMVDIDHYWRMKYETK